MINAITPVDRITNGGYKVSVTKYDPVYDYIRFRAGAYLDEARLYELVGANWSAALALQKARLAVFPYSGSGYEFDSIAWWGVVEVCERERDDLVIAAAKDPFLALTYDYKIEMADTLFELATGLGKVGEYDRSLTYWEARGYYKDAIRTFESSADYYLSVGDTYNYGRCRDMILYYELLLI